MARMALKLVGKQAPKDEPGLLIGTFTVTNDPKLYERHEKRIDVFQVNFKPAEIDATFQLT